MESSVHAARCATVSHRVSDGAACPWRLYYIRYYTGPGCQHQPAGQDTHPACQRGGARPDHAHEVRRKLDETHGLGEVPMPSRATFYRLMNYMDRGRRNFVSEASRRVSVNRPERPFTLMMALRPGENVVIDTNKLNVMCRYADGVSALSRWRGLL